LIAKSLDEKENPQRHYNTKLIFTNAVIYPEITRNRIEVAIQDCQTPNPPNEAKQLRKTGFF